jgi:hypothetical protein
MHTKPKTQADGNFPNVDRKRARQRRFRRALRELQERTGWTAKKLAAQCHVPHRTVLNWLAGTASPGPRRHQELCLTFGWRPEDMFASEAVADELFEDQYLDFEKLTQRYLRLQPDDPLEAWGHIPLAGALVFVDLCAAGFECRAVIDCQFGTRIEFCASKSVSLQVHVIFGRGLVISWLDEQGLVRETLDLSDANLQVIKNNLRAIAKL